MLTVQDSYLGAFKFPIRAFYIQVAVIVANPKISLRSQHRPTT